MSAAFVKQALAYAERGWPVFPLRPRRKEPITGRGFKDATTDSGQIRSWWQVNPEANLAIPTGSASGVAVLDVDPRHGGDESLYELEQAIGSLPDTPRVKTGGGGEHFYLAAPSDLRSRRNALGPGLDVKAEGGYVVAPCSIHESGRVYEWDVAPSDCPLAPVPPALLERLAATPRRVSGFEAGEPITEGARNNTLTSMAGVLRQRVGASEAEMYAYLAAVNSGRVNPPLADDELRQIAASVARYPIRGRTTETAPADAAAAAAKLTKLLALPPGLAVRGCRIVGRGREATADIHLSDGTSIYVPRLTHAMNATSLMELVVSTVGAEPELKNPDARHCVALMRKIGETIETGDADSDARQWGRDFLAAADVIDADLSDQAERWGAFARLRTLDPVTRARSDGETIARHSTVLRDCDGTLWVRTAWFTAYVRSQDPSMSPGSIAVAMERVGWTRPGKHGRIKATRPQFPDSDVQMFFIVPPAWDEVIK